MKTGRMQFVVVILLVALLALSVRLIGGVKAQELDPPEEVRSQDEVHLMTVVPGAIGIQGRLTNASGTPLDGSYSITFRLYDVESGGTSLCADTNTVNVENGLFNSYIDYCYDDLWGQKVWLGVKVGTDAEMEPRQVIYPVPYALTLKPGAVISGTADPVLAALASGSGDDDAFLAVADGTGEAVQAEATGGVGVAAFSDSFLAIQAYSYNTATYPALFGCVADSNTPCDSQRGVNAAGVMGYSTRDGGDGVHGESNDVIGRGVYGMNTDGGIAIAAHSNSIASTAHLYPTLYLMQQNSEGDFVVGAASLWGTRYWRVDRTGKGFFNGGTQASGADFAEQIAVTGSEADYRPGDVLIISADADRVVELSAEAYSTAVIGVYSSDPAVLAGAPDTDDPLAGIPVAVVGIVPCKVSAENGPIQRGDLLVTAATPGHAMHAGEAPPQGSVLGKALQPLEEGTGVITILVTLQ